MGKIILITGGQRSGKSRYAQELALRLSSTPVYMATARIWDEEFELRVKRHQQDRGENWINIEEEKHLHKHKLEKQTIVIDCITLWCTNFFFDNDCNVEASLTEIKDEFDQFTNQDADFIFVSNEIGMGGTSVNGVQRQFSDLQGWINQYVAQKSDEVFMMVSGIPLKVK